MVIGMAMFWSKLSRARAGMACTDAEGYRDAEGVQGWTWSPQKFQHGLNFNSAHKVFDLMAARNKIWNF